VVHLVKVRHTQLDRSCTISVSMSMKFLWECLETHRTLSYGFEESQNLKSVASLMMPSGSWLIVEAWICGQW
jgi:hypothetical protein